MFAFSSSDKEKRARLELKMASKLQNYFRNSYRSFSTRTNMHGFGELYNSKSIYGKLFWILALTLCLGITAYQLSKALQDYINEPYRTVIGKIKENELRYPHLKICYEHWMYWADFDKGLNLNFTKQSLLYGLSYMSDVYSEESFDQESVKLEFLSSMSLNNFTRLSQLYRAVAKDAPNEYFTNIHFIGNMLCYMMNSSKFTTSFKKMTDLTARKDKFNFKFEVRDKKVEPFETGFMSRHEQNCYLAYYLSLNETVFSSCEFRKELFIKNSTVIDSLQLPTYLMAGTDILEIRIDDVYVIVHSHATVSKWQNTSTFACKKRKISVISDKRCEQSCLERYRSKICSCVWFSEVSHTGLDYVDKLCKKNIYSNISMGTCVSLLFDKRRDERKVPKSLLNCSMDNEFCCSDAEKEEKEYQTCLKNCIPGCTIWNYYLGYIQRLKLGSFRNVLVKKSFTVDIYFPTNHDILSTNEIDSQSLENFLGNIGGLLGVWTGASILSLLQFIYLCCCGEFNWCCKKDDKDKYMYSKANDGECKIDMENVYDVKIQYDEAFTFS